MNNIKGILTVVLLLVTCLGWSQSTFPGVNYSAVYRDNSGQIIANSDLDVRVRVQTDNGNIIVWEEDHSVSSDGFGHFQCIIGNGSSTGNGIVTDFASINWGTASYTISISIDDGGGFVEFTDNELYSVPYALYARHADNQLFLNNLEDVDTSGIADGDILKWNGLNWEMHALSDTVDFASTAISATNSIHSDTAMIAHELINIPFIDTAYFAAYGDSSVYANHSLSSEQSVNSIYSDTAVYALNAENVWKIGGNEISSQTAVLGTSDSTDLNLITDQQSRMTIKANGKIGIGTEDPVADLHISSDIGLLAEGTFGSGALPITGAGSRMLWYPKKAAFRVGRVNGNKWDDQNIGQYSFAGGFDTRAKGNYAFAFGQSSTSNGEHAVAMGYASQAHGNTSVAMGSVSIATGVSAISMGRGTDASDSASFAIGYHTESHGKASGAFGFQSYANEDFSYVFGYRARANHSGCFVFSDASTYGGTAAYTNTSADNQFIVKASGGVYFYSDESLSSGVYLAAGSGSWSSLSDKNSKENIEEVDYQEVLDKINDIDVYSWNYISQEDDIRHIGPMAQDIYAAYELGESEKAINIVDMDGINLASLKAILMKMEELDEDLKDNIDYKSKYYDLLESFSTLENRIDELEGSIK